MSTRSNTHPSQQAGRNYLTKILDISGPYHMEGGIPLILYIALAVMSVAILKLDLLEQLGMIGSFAMLWTIGLVCFSLGERIYIVRSFLGGGVILAYAGAASLSYSGALSDSEIDYIQSHIIGNKFLYFFLATLVSSSILSMHSATLKHSLIAYFPIIFGGLALAAFAGIFAGWLVGIELEQVVTNFFLPIMGGGSGAGAIPMAEIYADVTGQDAAEYYSYAIAVLTLGNIVAILIASSLNILGDKYPAITGNGQLLRGSDRNDTAKESAPTGKNSSIAAVILIITILLVGTVLYSAIKSVHIFAWIAIISVVLNLSGNISDSMKASLSSVSNWGLKAFLVTVMVAVGLSADIDVIGEIFEFGNIFVIISIVVGAALGAGIAAHYLKCYAIEGALAGGLCMANTGGSGDLQVLGAARRMKLYPYAQLSSRLGGAVVLLLANYLFGILLLD